MNGYENVKAAFNKAYVDPTGRIKGDTQTCYVLALYKYRHSRAAS